MIEKMKKVTVVCVHADRERTVDRLAELGVVHVVDVTSPESEALEAIRSARDRAQRTRGLLAATTAAESAPGTAALDGKELTDRVLELQDAIREADDAAYHWRGALEALQPWGSFSRQDLELIEKHGYQVRLCRASQKSMPKALPDGAILARVCIHNKLVHYVVFAPEGVELGDQFEPVYLPDETDIDRVKANIAECEARRADARGELAGLAHRRHLLDPYIEELDVRSSQIQAHDGMGCEEHVAYLKGYVPASRFARLEDAAQANGWGLLDEDADSDDDRAPTLITVPGWLKLSKPIFSFLGILPGYSEADVSASVLVFLSLFFGIIIGDAGYGTIFLAIGVTLRLRVRDPGKKLPLNLFILLSSVTLLWGALSGNWFALPAESLPAPMRGISALTDAAVKNKNVQWLCFFIAAVHLSLARLWQAAVRINSREAIGHIGWAMLLWGNFFTAVELIAFPGTFPRFAIGLYAVGVVLVLACGVKWGEIGDVINLPFTFIGSFVDVLSYIRLFAVGLASYFIAASFNNMGAMIHGLSPWLIPAAVLVVLFGHLLNVALGFMGVLVHGVRLNTLEFSNQMGMTWSGRPYQPLQRQPSTQ